MLYEVAVRPCGQCSCGCGVRVLLTEIELNRLSPKSRRDHHRQEGEGAEEEESAAI